MDLFRMAKVVRLRSHHSKYLFAADESKVIQDKNGASKQAKWTIELVDNSDFIRLRCCYNTYLTASNVPFLGVGHKVILGRPARLDSSVEWEPVKDGRLIMLRTRYRKFLRANGGSYPYKNSVTHDTSPQHTVTQDWILWNLEVLEVLVPEISASKQHNEQSGIKSIGSSKQDDIPDLPRPPPKANGRRISYYIIDDDGNVDESIEASSFFFEGSSVQGLTQRLEEETRIGGLIVCTRHLLNDQLYPIHLQLPPNNDAMKVFAVPPSSRAAENLQKQGG